ncbi:MAG: hypothetical protein H6837_16735 [Planctomycetes bacterium]|nr:hypothetical protein [Planctomycetota bacterium]
MPDARLLLRGLEDYQVAVGRHLEAVRAGFDELNHRWCALREDYEGTSAAEFRDVWEGTTRMFQDYDERARAVNKILEKRIERLREYDRND